MAEGSRGAKYKTALCTSYLKSVDCKFGPSCHFAHGVHELRPSERQYAAYDPYAEQSRYPHRHSKYKTQLCRSLEKGEMCRFGAKCSFAHAPEELRVSHGRRQPNAAGDMGRDPNNAQYHNSNRNYGRRSGYNAMTASMGVPPYSGGYDVTGYGMHPAAGHHLIDMAYPPQQMSGTPTYPHHVAPTSPPHPHASRSPTAFLGAAGAPGPPDHPPHAHTPPAFPRGSPSSASPPTDPSMPPSDPRMSHDAGSTVPHSAAAAPHPAGLNPGAHPQTHHHHPAALHHPAHHHRGFAPAGAAGHTGPVMAYGSNGAHAAYGMSVYPGVPPPGAVYGGGPDAYHHSPPHAVAVAHRYDPSAVHGVPVVPMVGGMYDPQYAAQHIPRVGFGYVPYPYTTHVPYGYAHAAAPLPHAAQQHAAPVQQAGSSGAGTPPPPATAAPTAAPTGASPSSSVAAATAAAAATATPPTATPPSPSGDAGGSPPATGPPAAAPPAAATPPPTAEAPATTPPR